MGIITNGTVFDVYKKVDSLGLTNIFPCSSIIVSESIGISKPHEGIFQHALECFKCEASRTLFVGDNYFTDILGAKSIGMDTLWINKYDLESRGEVFPDYIVKNVLDMKELIIDEEKGPAL
jgi:FMN phosphatase YigB (HAD superfamily)